MDDATGRRMAALAQQYASRGWPVLPTVGKRPMIEEWETAATQDPWEARAAWFPGGDWAGLNIAIACGPAGLVVLDIDRKGGRDGFRELARAGIDLPETYTVRTPTGGLHHYYLAPRGIRIGSGANVLVEGVDIRAWGGIVVAAGSQNADGVYQVERDLPVAPLPPSLIDQLAGRPMPADARRAEELPTMIPEGERETRMVSLAGSARRRGACREGILALITVENATRCVPPLAEADLERIADSMVRYPTAVDTDRLPTAEDAFDLDGDLIRKKVVEAESIKFANRLVRSREAKRNRDLLGGLAEPVPYWQFLEAGPDPAEVCLWGNPVEGGAMAWARNQSLMIAGPPGTGKSTIALQVVLRMAGIVEGDVLGMPVVPIKEGTIVYFALDRADQIRQSMRRMIPTVRDTEQDPRLLILDNLPAGVDLREDVHWIAWLKEREIAVVVVDSAKDLGYDLNDSSEGQAFNQFIQVTLRAGVQILVTHHSRKVPRGDRKPLTLADLHGSQWVAAGAGSVLMLDGEAGGKRPVRMVHAKPLTVPMQNVLIELDSATGEVSSRVDDSDPETEAPRRATALQDRILEWMTSAGPGPHSGADVTRGVGAHSGSVHKALTALAEHGMVERVDGAWRRIEMEEAG